MSKPKIWALVTNGVRARILRALDDSGRNYPPELISRSRSIHLRNIISDKSGQTFSSARRDRRSQIGSDSDPIRRDMQDFAYEIIQQLESHRRAREFDKLIVLAAPNMLSILKEQTPQMLRHMIYYEHATNVVRLPESELRCFIRQILTCNKEI